MHNALVRLDSRNEDEKMTRHLCNTLWVRDALDRHEPDAIRLYLLSTHYRTPVVWSDEDIDSTARGLERIRAAVKDMEITGDVRETGDLTKYANQIRDKFIAAMDDDFNTPQAIASLYELAREINRMRGEGASKEMLAPAQKTMSELAGLLGLALKEPDLKNMQVAPFIDLLVEIRQELRDIKQYDLADKIRDELSKLGVHLEDGTQGTIWKMTR
jgi:cysteinyl-tRNA synthetase